MGKNTELARGETIVYNMENDTLKVKGGAKLGSGGKGGAAPKRKLEDPFKDKPVASSNTPPKETDVKDSTDKLESATGTLNPATGTLNSATGASQIDEDAAQAPQLEPVRDGRSRLIINPK